MIQTSEGKDLFFLINAVGAGEQRLSALAMSHLHVVI